MDTTAGTAFSPDNDDWEQAEQTQRNEKFLRIGEVAEQLGVTLRTLRFYEDKKLVAPKRVGTTRLYTERDVSRLKLIMMGRRVGFSLREVKQIMDMYEPDGSNYRQSKFLLEKGSRQLARLEKQRGEIESAIAELRGVLDQVGKSVQR